MTDSRDFFIGWEAIPPKQDRRFMLAASLALITGGGGLGVLLAGTHAPAGAGTWAQGEIRTFRGEFSRAPYPVLRTTDIDGSVRTVFLAGNGKVGLQSRLGDRADGAASVSGTLIARGDKAMIAVVDGPDWIVDAVELPALPAIDPSPRDVRDATLIGEILDAKCWFGAMRPSSGKIHKACASLCLRGGLPPAFCGDGALCGNGSAAPLLLDAEGGAHGSNLLAFAADPVVATGQLMRVGDVDQFRVDLRNIRRL